MAFNPANKRYFELTAHERELFIASNGNIKKLVESRINKYGEVEPMLSQPVEPLDVVKRATNSSSSSDESDDEKRGILKKVGSDLRFYEKIRNHAEEQDIRRVLKVAAPVNPLVAEFKAELQNSDMKP